MAREHAVRLKAVQSKDAQGHHNHGVLQLNRVISLRLPYLSHAPMVTPMSTCAYQ